jgi:hypothetical protein
MKYIFALLIILCFAECQQPVQKKNSIIIPPPPFQNYLSTKDTTRRAVLIFDKKRHKQLFDNTVKPADLSNVELSKIENIIYERVKKYNKSNNYPIKTPEKYFKQFIAITNSKGEKEVWINCCCEVEPDIWKKDIESVNDGGICFFQLKINLTKDKITEFNVNGQG